MKATGIGKEHIAPPEQGGTMRIWIDDLPCTFEAVFKMAEEAEADAGLRREVQMRETAKQLLDAAINAHMAIYGTGREVSRRWLRDAPEVVD
jgi:hypothetical protein